ncbi:MAG TPA: beta-L-arabinofuranosidase domain-containing protein, partial [Fimbriimonadaceae bacterium]|nr:beta-L-arabinofuranosidase domain-containing protein [Fimbriimonadaceae bacterium]
RWAERCEDVTFNSLPASMTPDLKALHYLTAPNMPLADARSKSPGLQNSGPMLLFNPWDHRCCQHNVAQGWPYYTEHLWMATDGNGLGAALYAPCEVTAKVGSGTPATIRESTNYPFGERVEFRFSMARRNKFPLTLRLPAWCDSPKLTLNGKTLWAGRGNRRAYIIVNRTWRNGDRLTLALPMHLDLTRWKGNKNSVSVQRGPLTYSLQIGEKYVRKGGTDQWPAYEIHPTTAWNYGLVPDLKQFRVTTRPMPADGQPFSETNTPVLITAPARKIPEWGLDMKGLVETLQQSPALSTQPVQTVTLVPMGAARIRISAFPTVTDRNGHVWQAAPKGKKPIPAMASHVFEGDTLDALSDGFLPKNSNDQSIPRFTWWDHKGGTEWVEYDLPSTKLVDRAEVYWFDDRGTGECRVPESWRLLYWDGKNWVEVQAKTPYRTDRNMFNIVSFAPVAAKSFRIEAKLSDGFSAGILEWVLK